MYKSNCIFFLPDTENTRSVVKSIPDWRVGLTLAAQNNEQRGEIIHTSVPSLCLLRAEYKFKARCYKRDRFSNALNRLYKKEQQRKMP